ncbi:hypothetical protein NPS46_24620 [Pseudomonas putida]|uniref:hypothetical protein n=1 Tax=Pseudomonas putida TaxID=303 RepID=UPI002363DAA6|nr:hypothetical protein [Pseudomonas putida]MDD2055742.1 hypothetical protein [Pseudomonas putida]
MSFTSRLALQLTLLFVLLLGSIAATGFGARVLQASAVDLSSGSSLHKASASTATVGSEAQTL